MRTTIEVTVLASGWLLGGTVGVGTVRYAASIGPLTHLTAPGLRLVPQERADRSPAGLSHNGAG